jgi:c(7)-type cytochrome triheme protein
MALSFAMFFIATIACGVLDTAQAEDDGDDIVFKDTGKKGPTTFSHKAHKSAGNVCNDCHDGIFKKKKGSADEGNAMTMKSLREGKFCGTCHDGAKAFSVKGNCKKCHPKDD